MSEQTKCRVSELLLRVRAWKREQVEAVQLAAIVSQHENSTVLESCKDSAR